jgi:mannan endo-1,4-beta-mannosidase
MPQTLTLGATGEDVVLLQTRLNALPSALPPLAVDGIFGSLTQQRVIEFQTTAFVQGVVDARTWGALLAGDAPQPGRETLYVEGRFLHDAAGKQVILRGIDLPLLDDWSFPADDKLADLAQTGANAVRIQWYINYGDGRRPLYTLADLDAFLGKCKANRIIPILGLWDATCGGDMAVLSGQFVPWWTSDDVVAVLDKHKRYLVVNLANELGIDRWSGTPDAALSDFKDAYKAALTSVRQKLHMPIMLDAPDCATSIEAWTAMGQELVDHDPDHNLLLSVHAYWAAYDGMPFIADAVNRNLPLVFGEIANKQDESVAGAVQYCFYDLDGLGQNQPAPNGFTYQALLKNLTTQDVGWLAWSWWPDACESRNMARYDENGQFQGLSPYGEDIVNNAEYGLKNCALRSEAFE